MTVTIGINGFGRIGRSLTRIIAAAGDPGLSIAAVNDLASTEKMAYGLRRDS
ncbi:MAG: glyceraldehyde 3-phosphate dehydrogenase NAD-binding domain-containing protein, partial [Actinoplanes sp.]